MTFDAILDDVGAYYTGKLVSHGASPRGADWNSPESQKNRFDQLLEISELNPSFSIIDYGCGYGALVEHMRDANLRFQYQGFDIADAMIARGRELFSAQPECRFTNDENELKPADYAVASGIFNVKLERSAEEWLPYILHTLSTLDRLGVKGFAFNLLTKYSDKEFMRPHLYYADPCFLFDYCKTRFSRQVALLHDYGLYEFTILVRKP